MNTHKLKIISLVGAFIATFSVHTIGETMQHTATIKSSQHAVLNKKNLDKIKRFMLKNGQTCTWSNMYNNNPCFSTAHFQFYLNPDPGGPNNHIQWNINCDPKKGDFNTLIIQPNTKVNNLKTHANFIPNSVHFIDKENIYIRFVGAQSKNQSALAIQSSQLAVSELLLASRKTIND